MADVLETNTTNTQGRSVSFRLSTRSQLASNSLEVPLLKPSRLLRRVGIITVSGPVSSASDVRLSATMMDEVDIRSQMSEDKHTTTSAPPTKGRNSPEHAGGKNDGDVCIDSLTMVLQQVNDGLAAPEQLRQALRTELNKRIVPFRREISDRCPKDRYLPPGFQDTITEPEVAEIPS